MEGADTIEEMVNPRDHKTHMTQSSNGMSRSFEVVHFDVIIFWIAALQVMNLWSGRDMVSVLKLKSYPRITYISKMPPSANNLSFATIALQGRGLFASLGQAATSIARGIAASNRDAFLVPGMLTVSHGVLSI